MVLGLAEMVIAVSQFLVQFSFHEISVLMQCLLHGKKEGKKIKEVVTYLRVTVRTYKAPTLLEVAVSVFDYRGHCHVGEQGKTYGTRHMACPYGTLNILG